MAEIISNQFTSTVSRATTSGTQEILSNQFTATINRSSDVPASLGDSLSTVVNIYKTGTLLTPVSSTPTTGQYRVTITGTTGCTASVQSDHKTIKLNSVTDNKGTIDISINIENKRTYIKSIPVATITSTQELNSSISQAQQTANKFNWLVKSGTSSSNMELTDDAYKLVSKNINLEGYTTINGGFTIDLQGNMTAKNGTFSGTITGSTLKTAATNNKYVEVKTSDYSVFNGTKKVISVGLRDLTYSSSVTGETTITTDTPCIYIGADGFNTSGGTSYTGQTGRYFGMIQSYNHLNSIGSGYKEYYRIPYLNFRYNTNYNTTSGAPASSNIRMFANGDIMLAPVQDLIFKTNKTDGEVSDDGSTEYELARFYSASSSLYTCAMSTEAVVNTNNLKGMVIGDNDTLRSREAYFLARVGDTTDGGIYRTWKPQLDADAWLGTPSYRWKTLYLSGSTVQTSDRRGKENVEYITNVSNPNAKISSSYTSEDIYEFVKNIPYATFNMKDDKSNQNRIGFILQDLLDDDICRDLILDNDSVKIEQDAETNTQPYMGFNQANYISMLGLALQEEIKKREALEEKLERVLAKMD